MVEIVLLLIYNAGDAARDALMFRAITVSSASYLEISCFPRWTKTQWLWHIIKWCSTYPLQLFVLIDAGFGFREIVVLALVMLATWQFTYRLILK